MSMVLVPDKIVELKYNVFWFPLCHYNIKRPKSSKRAIMLTELLRLANLELKCMNVFVNTIRLRVFSVWAKLNKLCRLSYNYANSVGLNKQVLKKPV